MERWRAGPFGPRVTLLKSPSTPVDSRARAGQIAAMTASELQDLILITLVRNVGGNRRRWRAALGPVKLYPVATHAHCNWSISPSGDSSENAAIERLLDQIRGAHPIITG